MTARAQFDIDLERGVALEEQFARILRGDEKIEVKYQPDARTHLFVETASRGKPSGLRVTTADWWVYFYDRGDRAIFVRTSALKALVYTRPIVFGGDEGTSEGVALAIEVLARPSSQI